MKTYVAVQVAVLTFIAMAPDAAHAGWGYRRAAVVPVARPVVITPGYYPAAAPLTIAAPNVVIGPLGRVHYVAPVRPVGNQFYFRY